MDHGTDINVSVDDMAVNMVSHAHGQGYADFHFLLPELVQKVDFGKGSYQMDNGGFCYCRLVLGARERIRAFTLHFNRKSSKFQKDSRSEL